MPNSKMMPTRVVPRHGTASQLHPGGVRSCKLCEVGLRQGEHHQQGQHSEGQAEGNEAVASPPHRHQRSRSILVLRSGPEMDGRRVDESQARAEDGTFDAVHLRHVAEDRSTQDRGSHGHEGEAQSEAARFGDAKATQQGGAGVAEAAEDQRVCESHGEAHAEPGQHHFRTEAVVLQDVALRVVAEQGEAAHSEGDEDNESQAVCHAHQSGEFGH
mmetsp:Transcript_35057/g.81736  ORF Transcript_35057/g.81736 Transcript_35057/m.81736 type:complete len:215 (+) Transcript_35057:75-719(+)